MNINEGYLIVKYIAQKTSGALVSYAQYQMLVNAAQQQYFNDLLPGDYANDPKMKYEQTMKISTKLLPFKTPLLIAVDTAGQAPYPSDWIYTSSIRREIIKQPIVGAILKNEYPVEIIADDMLSNVLSSRIVMPSMSKSKFYCTMYGGYMQFYPIEIARVKLTYLRKPAKIVMGTTTLNGRLSYNAGSSTQWEWNELSQYQIILIVLKMIGAGIREKELLEYAQHLKTEGVQ